MKRNGTLSLTHIEDLIGAYKPAACASSNSTRLTWDTLKATADPQPAGQAVHLDKLTSYRKAISNSRPELFLLLLEILLEIWLKEKVRCCGFKKCFKGGLFCQSIWGTKMFKSDIIYVYKKRENIPVSLLVLASCLIQSAVSTNPAIIHYSAQPSLQRCTNALHT